MRGGWRAAVLLAAGVSIVLAAPAPSAAQPAPAPGGAPRMEFGAGFLWTGSTDIGGGTASLTPNLNTPPFTLFDASAEYGAPAGLELRFAYRLTAWLLAGVEGQLSQGDVRVSIASDAEGAAPASFAGETLGQGAIAARVDVLIPAVRFWGGRVTPHVMASAGGFRHWHEGNVLIESGQIYGFGGGARVTLSNRPASRLSRLGLLAEIRVSRVSGGFHWGREARSAPAAVIEFYTGWGRPQQP